MQIRYFIVTVAASGLVWAGAPAPTTAPGSLISLDREGRPSGLCPLKHTEVRAEIAGFLAGVTVTQEFANTSAERIEAVYTFPLPHQAAVDDMTLLVGDRVVRGKIKRREEARAIYEAARAAGRLAGLLDQERPNIFTQSVANIGPGETVKVTIHYVEILRYEAGAYEFVFPMVVGPRYIPGNPTGRQAGGWAPDTDRVPDASRITPPVTPPGTRAGHDISIEVSLDAGLPIEELVSKTHEVLLERPAVNRAVVRLKQKAALPIKDFVLRYDVAGRKIQSALLAHRGAQGGFFTLILAPPEGVSQEDVTPKELVFVLDTSGSMSGLPIEKAKEAMRHALDGLYPRDRFNLITFSGDTQILFPEPVPATPENLAKAQQFLASQAGSGGTEMMKAIRAALDPSDSADHVRIVCFMTDGYVGDDLEIIHEVQKHPNARVFAFGVGSAVNRFLLSQMAEHGRGEVEFVGLNDDGSAAARRFHERIRNPLLTDIVVDWGRLPVTDVYPRRIQDLFSARPVVLTGRYTAPGRGVIRLRGRMAGREFEREMAVELPAQEGAHAVLATLWARARVADLMGQDYWGRQTGTVRDELREEITQLGLDYRLMTPYTSFVAVEETVVRDGGRLRRIEVPVEMPDGVSYEGVFGEQPEGDVIGGVELCALSAASLRAPAQAAVGGLPGAFPSASLPPPALAAADRAPASRLDPALEALAAKLRAGARIEDLPKSLVREGKVEVRIWLTETSPESLRQLKELGFELLYQAGASKLLIGRIPVAKLEALARLAAVRYVAPAAS